MAEQKRDHFDHERLDVYQTALDFVVLADDLAGGARR
jgi:hypothetical protein